MYLQPSSLVVYEAEIPYDAGVDTRQRQPNNDIDVYLKSLMENLVALCNDDVRLWDEYK